MEVLVCERPVVLINKLEGAAYGCYTNSLFLCPDSCSNPPASEITVNVRQTAELCVLLTVHAHKDYIAAQAVSPNSPAGQPVALLPQLSMMV